MLNPSFFLGGRIVVVQFLTIEEMIKRFIPLPRVFVRKMNVIAQLEFELAYYYSAAQCFNNYTTRTSP